MEETREAIERVMAMEHEMPLANKHTRHSHPAQGALQVLAAYLQSFKDFLYSIVSDAASACQEELHKLPHACQDDLHVTSCHHLSAARCAYLAVTVPTSTTSNLSLTLHLSFTSPLYHFLPANRVTSGVIWMGRMDAAHGGDKESGA